MNVINNIMESGVFTDIINNMNKSFEEGNLDIGQLQQSVQRLVSKSGIDKETNDETVSLMNNLMGGLSQTLENDDDTTTDVNSQPDIMGLMSVLSKANMGSSRQQYTVAQIEDNIQRQMKDINSSSSKHESGDE